MLFSNDRIAGFINSNFEPAWQSMRPVPTVRIDFGNGQTVTRTLHGNIATYICSADLQIYDVLPGLYQPSTYLQQLEQLLWLSRYVGQSGKVNRLRDYHRRQAAALAEHGQSEALVRTGGGISITGQELGVKYALQPTRRLHQRAKAHRSASSVHISIPVDLPAERRRLLEADTQINETVRRKLIHEYLATRPITVPDQIQKWLYREVLKADLDDPFMGLGELLGQSSAKPGQDG